MSAVQHGIPTVPRGPAPLYTAAGPGCWLQVQFAFSWFLGLFPPLGQPGRPPSVRRGVGGGQVWEPESADVLRAQRSSPFLVSPLSLGAEAPLKCGSGAAWAGRRICFSRLIKTELTRRNWNCA